MSDEGFISTYFLVLFLYVSLMISAMAMNDADRLCSMMNLRTNQTAFLQEAEILQDIRCLLAQGSVPEGEEMTDGGIAYSVYEEEDGLEIEVGGSCPERILVELTDEKIASYSVQRKNPSVE